jgi:Acyl-CoA reductase (LuxC)
MHIWTNAESRNNSIVTEMNLPNYFLADLPPEATLTVEMIGDACATLKQNRARYLADRPTEQLIRIVSAVAEDWLQPENRFRKLALESGPSQTGFGGMTLTRGLDSFFHQLTRDNLHALLVQDLGDTRRLDEFVSETGDKRSSRSSIAIGPEFLVHITAGSIPNPTLTSIVFGLLTRSAQFVKCATGASLLPRLFAHSIYEADAKLGACLEIAEWSGGNESLESALFEHADCVTATGNDETLSAIRAKLAMKARFVGYGHRVSFGYVSGEVLFGRNARKVAADAANDVVAWNQLGCLSPHLIYVQSGGEVMPRRFAEWLAEELEQLDAREPRGELPRETAATIASRRAVYEVRAAHSPDTQMWHSKNSTAWTVVYEEDARFQTSCLNRFIYVKPVLNLDEALRNADAAREHVSTVGLAASPREVQTLATCLARWGAERICSLGQMQNPPLTWRHDGRPALGDLVKWTDWETS